MRPFSLPLKFAALLATFVVLLCLPAPLAADEADDDPIFPNLADSEAVEEVPAVRMGEFEPGLNTAAELLEENFHSFLEREPLGFDSQLGDLLAEDAAQLYQAAYEAIRDPSSVDPAMRLEIPLALVVIALFFVLFLLIDRHATRLGHRLQARTHFDSSAWMSTAARKAILVLARTVAFATLVALSFFPVRAVFGVTPWTLLLTDCLLIFLIYRSIKTVLVTTLRLNPRSTEVQEHYARLERFAMTALRLLVFFSVLIAAIERFEYHEQMAAFVSFALRLTFVGLPVYLFWMRESVLAILPPQPQARLYRALRGALNRNFRFVLGATIILLGFNAAGYHEAATFFLTRGYALIAITVIWFAALERLHYHVVTRVEEDEDRDDVPSPLLKALEQWLVAIGSLVIIGITLRLLGIYDPIIALLRIPLVSIGHLDLSVHALLTIALIVVATVLSMRLFQALLNAKVYPVFNVDIGVAYATNTLLNYALVVIAFILCLVALGVRLSAVMVVMASLGVGIGFGLQNIAENLISGFILLFGRAVKKGDFITVNQLYGRVEAVGARSVVVRTPDNYSMLIPSKEIVSGRIINWTFHDSLVRIHIPIGVSYDSNPTEVRQILLDAAAHHPDILDEPEPDVWIVEFGDNSIQFELLVHFDCQVTNERTLKGKFNFILWEALQDSGVEIPYPQRDLHLRSLGDLEVLPGGAGSQRDDAGPSDSDERRDKPRRQDSPAVAEGAE